MERERGAKINTPDKWWIPFAKNPLPATPGGRLRLWNNWTIWGRVLRLLHWSLNRRQAQSVCRVPYFRQGKKLNLLNFLSLRLWWRDHNLWAAERNPFCTRTQGSTVWWLCDTFKINSLLLSWFCFVYCILLGVCSKYKNCVAYKYAIYIKRVWCHAISQTNGR